MGITLSSPKPKITELPNLPDEVIEQILSRLPVKSLLQFSCVSKSWNYTICHSQQFCKLHLLNSARENVVIQDGAGKFKHCSVHSLFSKSVTNAPEVDNFSVTYPKELCWVGSCNGLVCLSLDKNDLVLWNPSIRQSRKLPASGLSSYTYRNYGFGYDKSSDDYKVVGFSYNMKVKHKSGFIVRVFSLKTGEWKSIKNHMSRRQTTFPALFANGTIHWTMVPYVDIDAEEGSGGYYEVPETNEFICTPRWDIAYLDLETEEYGMIHKPDFVEGGYTWNFAISEGCFYVFCLQFCRTDVWKIDGSYGVGNFTWTKVVSIPNSDGFLRSILLRSIRKYILRVLNNCEILFLCGPKLVIFNMKDYSFRCFTLKDYAFRYPKIQNSDDVLMAGIYVESLVSLLV